MKLRILFASAPLWLVCAAAPAASEKLSAADETAAFQAAGFKLKGTQWRACVDDPAPDTHGEIGEVRDLNGDGRPEALITEGGNFCYGNQVGGYWLVSQQADGRWKLITSGTGNPYFLKTRGVGGWPDIEIGGPGFCFPVVRWNGRAYVVHRHQYENRPCRSQ